MLEVISQSVRLPRVGFPSGACSSRSRGTRDPTGTTCRARCRDGSLSVSVYACFFSCFSDAGSIAKSPPLGVAGMLPMWKCCQSQCCQFSIGARRECVAWKAAFPVSGRAAARHSRRCGRDKRERWGYGVGEKAVFLMRRISRGSIFVKPKHLPPRSFSEAPMRYSSLSSMMRKRSWNSSL